jgi:Ca-activated chloride channel family protein
MPRSSPVAAMWCRHLVLVAATMLTAPATAQDQPPPVFVAGSELVVLQVTVTDRTGTYIEGLPAEAFRIVEDGQAQTLNLFADTDTPVTVGLLVDSSTSMHSIRHLIIAAAATFAAASHPRDEVFALAFNEDVSAALPASAPFTNDRFVLEAALERTVRARGRTALYDAISSGVDYLARGTRERRVLVVLSDGGDNASHGTRTAAVRKAQASNTVIYTVALIDPLSRGANPALLEELAQASGGVSFRPADSRGLAEALEQVARHIRHGYTLGYTPTNLAHDDAFRRVRVVVTAPPGRRFVARTRSGYVAGTRTP